MGGVLGVCRHGRGGTGEPMTIIPVRAVAPLQDGIHTENLPRNAVELLSPVSLRGAAFRSRPPPPCAPRRRLAPPQPLRQPPPLRGSGSTHLTGLTRLPRRDCRLPAGCVPPPLLDVQSAKESKPPATGDDCFVSVIKSRASGLQKSALLSLRVLARSRSGPCHQPGVIISKTPSIGPCG